MYKRNREDSKSSLCTEKGIIFFSDNENLCSFGFKPISVILIIIILQAENPNADDSNGGLYDAMRRELRHAVEEIKMELEQVLILLSFFQHALPHQFASSLFSANLCGITGCFCRL